MTQQERWHQQRMTLLRTHHKEWGDYAVQEAQARRVLVKHHRDNRAGLNWKENALEWAAVLKHYNEEVLGLATASKLKEKAMRERQKRESLDLEERFKRE